MILNQVTGLRAELHANVCFQCADHQRPRAVVSGTAARDAEQQPFRQQSHVATVAAQRKEAAVFAWRRTAVRKRVIVNLTDKAFSGVLWAKRGPLLVLRDVELLEAGRAAQPVDGEIVIERARVEFIQVLSSGGG